MGEIPSSFEKNKHHRRFHRTKIELLSRTMGCKTSEILISDAASLGRDTYHWTGDHRGIRDERGCCYWWEI
jgi:hypothetical protein